MSKTAKEYKRGIVEEAFPSLTFKVRAEDDGREILAHLCGKMRLNNIRVYPGDRVLFELGPDGRRGRIVKRL